MSSLLAHNLARVLIRDKPLTDSSFSATIFREEVNDAPVLRNALITSMHCYQEGKHQFLLLHLELDSASREIIYARTERIPDRYNVTQRFLGAINTRADARDTVALSDDREKLKPGKHEEASLHFTRSMRLYHLTVLLEAISRVPAANKYDVRTTNCWWFCATIMSLSQQRFQGCWTSAQKTKWTTMGIGQSKPVYEEVWKAVDTISQQVYKIHARRGP